MTHRPLRNACFYPHSTYTDTWTWFGPIRKLDSRMPQGPQGMNKAVEENNVRNQYSIPGILHFIQHEWARFEMERSQWEVEKAELQARIAFLQGERKGQENLKNDLVRRIKMLEYALKQERAKYAKLKYGGDGGDIGPPPQVRPIVHLVIQPKMRPFA